MSDDIDALSPEHVDDWPDFVDDDNRCEGDHGPEEECPLCCSNGGIYQPGTEDCDFCSWDKFCAELSRSQNRR